MRASLLFALLILLGNFPTFGQNYFSAHDSEVMTFYWQNEPQREIIPVGGKTEKIRICDLDPGKKYIIGLFQEGGFNPLIYTITGMEAGEELMFQAENECEIFNVISKIKSLTSGMPVWFSLSEISEKKENNGGLHSQVPISVTGGTASNLIENVLIGGNCFDVTNVTLNGYASGIGSFSNGTSSIGLADGVIINTGDINNALGPNSETGTSTDFPGVTSDPDLQQLVGGSGQVMERNMIEFDFTPTNDTVSFRYVFASEEYCDYVGSIFNDVFGFFISGPGINGPFTGGAINLAQIPGGGGNVAINSVNWSTNSAYYVDNVPVGQSQNSTGCTTAELNNPAYAPNDIEFDGFTTILTATAIVIPCSTYHIKLAVGDVSDGIFDSAVFLEANSFDAGGQAKGEGFSATTGTNIVYEQCADGVIIFTRVGGNINESFVVHFSLDPSSTATEGVDFAALPDSITIPAGSTTFTLPVTIFSDNITEGQEKIVLSLANPCSCTENLIELIIDEVTPVEASLQNQNFCGSSGGVTLTPSVGGGLEPYSYIWDDGSTTATITVNPSTTTTYTVTVTDNCNGQDTASATITILTPPTATISGNYEICAQGNTTSVDIPVNFTGTPPWTFVYSIDGENQAPITTSTNPYILTLSEAGIIELESVSDPDGECQGTVSGQATITEVDIHLSTTVTDVTCFGGSDGSIEVTVSGGTSPYTYDWSNGGSGSIQTDLSAGTYSITVTDVNGCEDDITATVNEPPQPPPLVATPDNQTICGLDPTTLEPTVSGGVPPYTYVWDDGSSGSTITITPSGSGTVSHDVTITDDCGDQTTSSVSATFFEEPTATISGTFEICAQGNVQPVDIIINFTGDAPWEFVYEIDGVPQPPIITSNNPYILTTSTPGTYTLESVEVPGENCPGTVSGSATLTEVVINPQASATDETCFGESDGTVTAVGSGGSGPYTYVWNNGSTNDTQTGLPTGTYSVTVTDSNGCTGDALTTVNGPPILTASAISPTPANCYNPTGGSVSVTAGGGTPGYTYFWNNGSTSANPVNLPAGIYNVTVTDANGCTETASTEVLDDTTPPNANANSTGIIDCINTSITISGSGSSTGSGITYQWSGPGIVSGGNSLNPVVDVPGVYTILVTDTGNGCTAEASTTVIGDQTPPIATASGGVIDCNNPIIAISGVGSSTGNNFTYQWTGPGILGGGNTLTPTVNAGGTYTLTVSNTTNGCSSQAFAMVEDIIEYPDAVASADPLTCVVSQITIDGSGSSTGPNFTYEWTTVGGNIIFGGNTLYPMVDEPGTYFLTVTNDNNGCTSQTQVTVPLNNVPPIANATSPPLLTCINTTTQISGSGSSTGPDITYDWTGPGIVSGGNTLYPIVNQEGTYTLVVTDNDTGCTNETSVQVNSDTQPPNAVIAPPGFIDCNFPQIVLDGTPSSGGSGIDYQWITFDGNIVSGGNTATPLVDAAGTYTLIVVDNQNGCSAETSATVEAFTDPPEVDAGPNQLLTCIVTFTNLDGTNTPTGNNLNFQWNGPGIVSGGNTLTPLVNQIGTYELIVTNTGTGCTASDLVEVTLDSDYPVADAGPPQEINCGNPTVNLDGLNSSSGGIYIYSWNTLDGNIIGGWNSLTPTVDATGTYELTVTNTINGCTEVSSVEVTDDFDYPVSNILPPDIINCSNLEILIDATGSSSNGNFTYTWTTLDGNIVAGGNSLEPTVDQPGTYTLTILNNDNECEESANVIVDADLDTPVPEILPPATLNCTVGEVIIDGTNSSNGPNLSYQWTTANGNILSGQNTLEPTVDAPGIYELTITNLQNTCSASETIEVFDDVTTPIADVGIPDTLNCSIIEITLDGTAGGTGTLQYLWTTTDGNILSGENTLNPVVDASGSYLLTVTNLDNDCIAESMVEIDQDVEIPLADAGAPATLNCYNPTLELDGENSSAGVNMNYQWTTPDGNILSGEITLTPTVDEPGTYILVVTNTENTCVDTAEVLIDLNNEIPIAGTGPDLVMGCDVSSLELEGTANSSNPILEYEWTTADGNILSGVNTLNPVIDAPGLYTLTVSDPFNGCFSTAEVEVGQNTETPVVAGGPGGQINCTVSEITLLASATGNTQNFAIQWTTPDGNIVSGATALTPVVDAGGTYELVVTDTTNNCFATATVEITEDANIPVADVATSGGLNCVSQQVTLDATASTQGPGIDFEWTSPDGNFVGGQNTLSPTIDAPGIYTLSIFDTNNDCQATTTVTIPMDTLAPTVSLTGGILTCDVTAITIDANTALPTNDWSVSWTSPDGQIDSGDDTMTPVVSTPGNYVLTTLNNTNGCTATTAIEVTEYTDLPIAEVEEPDILTCVQTEIAIDASASSTGQIFDYQWNTNDGNIVSGENSLELVVDAPGVYDLLITNTVNGCTTNMQTLVTQNVNLPPAVANPSEILTCTVLELTLDGTGTAVGSEFFYQWTTPDGNILNNQNTLSPTIDMPGTYELLVTNTLTSCASVATVEVPQDIQTPVANAGPPAELTCAVNQVSLDGTASSNDPFMTFLWTTQDGEILFGETTPTPTVGQPGTYSLLVTNTENGCSSLTDVGVSQDVNLPIADAGEADDLTCVVHEVNLDGSDSQSGPNMIYEWTSTGGNILSGANTLSPTVDAVGTYQLTVTNLDNGCSSVSVVEVENDLVAPEAEAGETNELNCVVSGLNLNGNNSSVGPIYVYQWTTTDGNILSGGGTLMPVVDAPGNYELLVTNAINGCTATDLVLITQSLEVPDALVAPADILTCAVLEIEINATASSQGSEFAYQWTTSNGNILSGGNSLTPTVDEPGVYELVVTNNDNGCTNSVTANVPQDIVSPIAEAGEADDLTCVVLNINLDAQNSSAGNEFSYDWTTNNGNILSGNTTLNPTVNEPGTYILTVTNNVNGCESTDEVIVILNDLAPLAVVAPPDVLTCAVHDVNLDANGTNVGPNFEYLWTTTDGNILSGETSLTPTVNEPGTYFFTVSNNINGCTETAQTIVIQDIVAPVADAGESFVFNCVDEVQYLDGSASQSGNNILYQWDSPDGNIATGATTITPGITQPGIFNIIVTNLENGCSATDDVTVIEDLPEANLRVEQPPCYGDLAQISFEEVTGGASPYLYSMDGGETFYDAITFTNIEPGQYSLVVQDVNGCEHEQTVNIYQPNKVVVEVEPEIELDLGDTYQIQTFVNLQPWLISEITWSPAEGLSCDDCLDPIIQPLQTTLYTVTVKNENGCEDSAPILLRVRKDRAIYIPNAFSPNGDGVNDKFLIYAKPEGVAEIKTFLVFSRWGESVWEYHNFQPNDPASGWDGYHRDEIMNPAVFAWFAEIEFIDGTVKLYEGDVTLIR